MAMSAHRALRDLEQIWMREWGMLIMSREMVWRTEDSWKVNLWVEAPDSNACSRNVLP